MTLPGWQQTGTSNPIYFLYDSGGKLWGLKYTDGNMYFYVRNAQGDIIKIVNGSGTVVVEYSYDAWGAGDERCRWQMKRVGGSVNKGVCQAAVQADDHCEQRISS